MEKELEGLKYDSLQLGVNTQKIVGKVNNSLNEQVVENEIHKDAVWLVAGLGYLKKDIPDNVLQESLNDTIIVSKKDLIEFIKSKK